MKFIKKPSFTYYQRLKAINCWILKFGRVNEKEVDHPQNITH